MSPLDKFEISIRRKDDKIIAAVPQLGLYATASEIHGALDALERKKAALLQDLTAAGEVENLSAVAVADPAVPTTSQGLAQFTLKVGIIVVLVAIAIVVTTNLVATKIEATRAAWQTTLQEHSKIGGAEFWSKVEQGLVATGRRCERAFMQTKQSDGYILNLSKRGPGSPKPPRWSAERRASCVMGRKAPRKRLTPRVMACPTGVPPSTRTSFGALLQRPLP